MTIDYLDSLTDRSAQLDEQKADYRVRACDLTLNPNNGHLVLAANPLPYDDSEISRFGRIGAVRQTRELELTDTATLQLHSKLGQAHFGRGSNKTLPTEYLGKFPNDLYASILNWTLGKSDGAWKIRACEDSCRAVLDSGYPRIWNTEVLRQLRRALDKGLEGDYSTSGLNAQRSFVSADELFIRLWWQGSGTGNYRIGIAIGNGEIGNRTFSGYPCVQRHSCENSIMTTQISTLTGQESSFRLVHYRGASANAMMIQFYAALPGLIGASAVLINRMIEAEAIALPNFHQILNGLAVEHGWKPDLLDRVQEGTEGQRTLAGVVNGISFAAHEYASLTEPERASMELLSGDYLFAKPQDWTRLARQGEERKRIRA